MATTSTTRSRWAARKSSKPRPPGGANFWGEQPGTVPSGSVGAPSRQQIHPPESLIHPLQPSSLFFLLLLLFLLLFLLHNPFNEIPQLQQSRPSVNCTLCPSPLLLLLFCPKRSSYLTEALRPSPTHIPNEHTPLSSEHRY